jgi:hypothetical protein
MYKKFALMLFSATGALALQATAAMAGWVSYGNTNPITSSSSTWRCASTQTVPYSDNVLAQVCTVRSADKAGVQGAIIVRNNNSYLYDVSASMTVYYESGGQKGYWSCSPSPVGANSWSVCFGTTFPASIYNYATNGYANKKWLGYTGSN